MLSWYLGIQNSLKTYMENISIKLLLIHNKLYIMISMWIRPNKENQLFLIRLGQRHALMGVTWKMKMRHATFLLIIWFRFVRRIYNPFIRFLVFDWEVTLSNEENFNSYKGLRDLSPFYRLSYTDAFLILTCRYSYLSYPHFCLYLFLPQAEKIPYGSFTSKWSRGLDKNQYWAF